jgi:hypothetical protein
VPILQGVVRWYHSLFHVAQLTIHDRWVKRLRLLAFLSATSIATQIVLRSALGYVGMENILPTSILGILIASAIWLVAYPAMWLRMLTVVVEMEAKKEYEAIKREIHKLHEHHHPRVLAPDGTGAPRYEEPMPLPDKVSARQR